MTKKPRPRSSFGWQKSSHMNEKKVIIEDELTRTRKHRKHQEYLVKRLKELNAPQVLIERHEEFAKMTHREFENWHSNNPHIGILIDL